MRLARPDQIRERRYVQGGDEAGSNHREGGVRELPGREVRFENSRAQSPEPERIH